MRKVIILGALSTALLSFTYGCGGAANTDNPNYDTTQQHNTSTDGNANSQPGRDTSVTTGGNIGDNRNATSGNQDTSRGTVTQGGRDTL